LQQLRIVFCSVGEMRNLRVRKIHPFVQFDEHRF
jgi:hypothetical protein